MLAYFSSIASISFSSSVFRKSVTSANPSFLIVANSSSFNLVNSVTSIPNTSNRWINAPYFSSTAAIALSISV